MQLRPGFFHQFMKNIKIISTSFLTINHSRPMNHDQFKKGVVPEDTDDIPDAVFQILIGHFIFYFFVCFCVHSS